MDRRQVGGLGHQCAEPRHLARQQGAFLDQLRYEADLAAVAPQLLRLSTEIEHRQLALGISLAQRPPLALAATLRFFQRGMEGRVAEADVEAFAAVEQPQQDLPAIGLLAHADGLAEAVGLHNRGGCGDGGAVDVRTHELPAIVAMPQQRVDAIGAGADVQRLDGCAAWYHAFIVFGQQVGEEVQVVRTSRNRRAQVIRRNVPMGDAIERLEQRAVEHPYRLRIGEVDAFLAVRIEDHERCQFGAGFDQLRKVVLALMPIARVQGGLFTRRSRFGWPLRLLARWFAGIGHGFDVSREVELPGLFASKRSVAFGVTGLARE